MTAILTKAGHKELYAHSTTRLTCLPVLDQLDGKLSLSKKRIIRSQTGHRPWLEIEITFRQDYNAGSLEAIIFFRSILRPSTMNVPSPTA